MADQSKNKTKDSPKVVAKTVDNSTRKDPKTTSPRENRATTSDKVPNSAANAIAKNGVSAKTTLWRKLCPRENHRRRKRRQMTQINA